MPNFRDIWKSRHFQPGAMSLLTNPYHLARTRIFWSLKASADHLTGRLLDVGCGSKPYRSLFTKCTSYEGLDIDQPRNRERNIADHFYDGKNFPFPSAVFDSVLCSQVLEHVYEPEPFCQELARVLRPNGYLLLTVPFVWDEHEQPWDCRRYTSYGLRELMLRSGFEIVLQKKLLIGYVALFQLMQARMQKSALVRLQSRLGVFSKPFELLNFPFNLVGECLDSLPNQDEDLYLDNVVLLKRRGENG